MSWSTVVKYLQLTWQLKKLSIQAAMSYRASFLIQVFGMVFNNAAWIILWALFFKRFPTLNGWGLEHTLLLYSFGTLAFALCVIPAEGVAYLARYVVSGELDSYLTMPKNVLWSIAVSKVDISAIGDGLFGFALMFYIYGFALSKIFWFLLLTSLSAILFFDFLVILQSLSFWLGDIEDVAKRIIYMLIGFMFYPQSIFSGFLKIIMMTIMPAFFVVTVPLSLLTEFSWCYLAILLASVMVGTAGALWIFNKGLARYESGNLMTTRQ
jgi:ABC-2 type transport system permease protein